MTEIQAEIIIHLADAGMNISGAARSVYLHRSTVNYHIAMIRQRTGKDPLNFYDLCDLLSEARTVLKKEIDHVH